MPELFLLQHLREDDESENVKVIGIYSTEERASEAIERLKTKPGFRDYPDGFCIDAYTIDEDHWIDGFGEP